MGKMKLTIFGKEHVFEPVDELYFQFENGRILIKIVYDDYYEEYQVQIFTVNSQIYYGFEDLEDSQKFVDKCLKAFEQMEG
jgi:hypothetical protein